MASYKRDWAGLPRNAAEYRTPSPPPSSAREPLSPSSSSIHVPHEIFHPPYKTGAASYPDAVKENGPPPYSHQRTASATSAMEAFATIALATSPTAQASSAHIGHTFSDFDERSPKRARSEKWSPARRLSSPTRPLTSSRALGGWQLGYTASERAISMNGSAQHAVLDDTRQSDAELLLSVSRAAFSSHTNQTEIDSKSPPTKLGDAEAKVPLADAKINGYMNRDMGTAAGGHEAASEQYWGGEPRRQPSNALNIFVEGTPPHLTGGGTETGAYSNGLGDPDTSTGSAEDPSNGVVLTSSDKAGSHLEPRHKRAVSHGTAVQPGMEYRRFTSVPLAAPNTQIVKEPQPVTQQADHPMDVKLDAEAHVTSQVGRCAGCEMIPNSLGDAGAEEISWISCDGCKSWYHFACAGLSEKQVRSVDRFICFKCRDVHGPTTFVRKSARAHTAIDYAGLNEGVVKSSADNPDHPYIKPIKENSIKCLPENFARMRPELVTKELFERGNGWKEPIVIPASMNPQRDLIFLKQPKPVEETKEDEEFTIASKASVDSWLVEDWKFDFEPDLKDDGLGMVLPRDLTVRRAADLYGPEEKVDVIDVKSQGEAGSWNMRKWADYFESKQRKFIRNVISLEISRSPLGRLIRRPDVVRHLDLVDSVWPPEAKAKGDFPPVQLYCLMSVANSYTDFHIDFGGSSVFYHILKGAKTFLFIPPHNKHLKKYEQWCLSPAQNHTFLAEQTRECYRVDLTAGDTMLIPSGWIHSVWTPEDSLVIGGNFLTRLHYEMQINIAEIEKTTKVPRKFRHPHFQRIMWLTAIRYLSDDSLSPEVADAFYADQDYQFERRPLSENDYDAWGDKSPPGAEHFQARYYSKHELNGLPHLLGFLHRTALISMGNIVDGITADTRTRVTRAIPKNHGLGQPLDVVKQFATWIAWKRGNEKLPPWAHPDAAPLVSAPGPADKKVSATALKRLERQAALEADRKAPERQSERAKALAAAEARAQEAALQAEQAKQAKQAEEAEEAEVKRLAAREAGFKHDLSPDSQIKSNTSRKRSKSLQLVPKKVACAACRKRRAKCKHKTPGLLEPADGFFTPDVESQSKAVKRSKSMGNLYDQNTDSEAVSTSVQTTPSRSNARLPSSVASASKIVKSKACDKCRKSKRRCIHNENGEVDPVKAEAAPEKRVSSGVKRSRPVLDEEQVDMVKKPRREDTDELDADDPNLDAATAAGAVNSLDDLDGTSPLSASADLDPARAISDAIHSSKEESPSIRRASQLQSNSTPEALPHGANGTGADIANRDDEEIGLPASPKPASGLEAVGLDAKSQELPDSPDLDDKPTVPQKHPKTPKSSKKKPKSSSNGTAIPPISPPSSLSSPAPPLSTIKQEAPNLNPNPAPSRRASNRVTKPVQLFATEAPAGSYLHPPAASPSSSRKPSSSTGASNGTHKPAAALAALHTPAGKTTSKRSSPGDQGPADQAARKKARHSSSGSHKKKPVAHASPTLNGSGGGAGHKAASPTTGAGAGGKEEVGGKEAGEPEMDAEQAALLYAQSVAREFNGLRERSGGRGGVVKYTR